MQEARNWLVQYIYIYHGRVHAGLEERVFFKKEKKEKKRKRKI